MKALSIRPIWAWAILHAGKRVENRSRKDGRMPSMCSHRGPLLIHAGLGCTPAEFYGAADFIAEATDGELHWGHADFARFDLLPRGGIVGICDVIGHIDDNGTMHGVGESVAAWWIPGSYGLILDNVRPLPFVPCKGRSGLFEVDTDGERHG